MLPTTMHSAEVMVTARHIAGWPEERNSLVPADCWGSAQRVVLRMPALKRAVPVCRSLVRSWLDGQQIHDEDTRYLVLLVLSELFTNAIQYSAGPRITCRIGKSENHLHIEVHDRGEHPRCRVCATRGRARNTAGDWNWSPSPPRDGAAGSRRTTAAPCGPRCRWPSAYGTAWRRNAPGRRAGSPPATGTPATAPLVGGSLPPTVRQAPAPRPLPAGRFGPAGRRCRFTGGPAPGGRPSPGHPHTALLHQGVEFAHRRQVAERPQFIHEVQQVPFPQRRLQPAEQRHRLHGGLARLLDITGLR